MKNLNIVLVVLIVGSLILNIYFYTSSDKDISISGGLNNQEEIHSMSKGKNAFSEKKMKAIDLKKSCNQVIDGDVDDFLYNTVLIKEYNVAIGSIEKGKKEYLDFVNLYNTNCDYFKGTDNYYVCDIVKNKDFDQIDVKFNENAYLKTLIKSLITKKNLCLTLSSQKELDDCSTGFQDFIKITDNEITPIIGSSYRNIGKAHTLLGETEYIKRVNSEFIEKCNDLKI